MPMISCSHWGMFFGYRSYGMHEGFGAAECDEIWV
jgi:hypothetical protein